MDLTKAEEIKKRWQEYIEELYKKDFHDPDNYDGVITHLEPDILECEDKWALESITTNKASGGDGISSSKRQCCENAALIMLANLENSAVENRSQKGQFSFQFQRKFSFPVFQFSFPFHYRRKVIPKKVQTVTQLHSSQH